MSPVPLCLEKWGVMTTQLLWERRPWAVRPHFNTYNGEIWFSEADVPNFINIDQGIHPLGQSYIKNSILMILTILGP